MECSLRRIGLTMFVVAVRTALPATIVPAQAQQADDQVAAALVVELRLLRTAIANLMAANSRIRALSVRASQQEQRLSRVSDQLLTMRTELVDVSVERSVRASQLERIEERIRFETDPQLRQELEKEQRAARFQFNTISLKEAALQAEVDQLSQQAMAEQSRLTEIQQQFSELDRLLWEKLQ